MLITISAIVGVIGGFFYTREFFHGRADFHKTWGDLTPLQMVYWVCAMQMFVVIPATIILTR